MNRISLALFLALCVVLGAACSGGDGDGADGPTGGTPAPAPVQPPGWEVVDEAHADPIAFADRPVWGSHSDGAVPRVETAAFHDDVALVLGGDEMSTRRLDAVDLVAGRVLWSVDELDGHELPGGDGALLWIPEGDGRRQLVVLDEAGPDGTWAVVVAYRRPGPRGSGQDEHGVAALSGETGEVLWQTPVTPAGGEPGGRRVQEIGGGSDGVVVLFRSSSEPSETRDLTALDPSDGSIRWQATGIASCFEPALPSTLAAGDTVLAHELPAGNAEDAVPAGRVPNQTVVGWDAVTGERQWDLSDAYRRSRLVLTAGDVVLVEAEVTDEDEELVVLDAGSGRELDSFGREAGSCASDREVVIACVVRDTSANAHVASFLVEDRQPGVSGTVEEVGFSWGPTRSTSSHEGVTPPLTSSSIGPATCSVMPPAPSSPCPTATRCSPCHPVRSGSGTCPTRSSG